MARLRPITNQALTDVHYDIKSKDVIINEGEQYSVASNMLESDKSILYFLYWDDADFKAGGMYTYPIDKEDIEYWRRNNGIDE